MFANDIANNQTVFKLTKETSQLKCYPNPFTSEITIEVQSFGTERVNIDDINGKLARKLYNGQTKNSGILVWDGRNDGGSRGCTGNLFNKC